jgi:hypothetical protein
VSVGTRRWSDDAYWARFPPDFGCDDSTIWDACTARQAGWLLLPPAAAGALAILYLYLRASAEAGHGGGRAAGDAGAPGSPARAPPRRRLGLLGRAAAAQLPPARLWTWWCGGISGADAAVVAGWLLVNGLWLGSILKRCGPAGDTHGILPVPTLRPSGRRARGDGCGARGLGRPGPTQPSSPPPP